MVIVIRERRSGEVRMHVPGHPWPKQEGMKIFSLLLCGAGLALVLAACDTAHDAAADAGHVVKKTGHVIEHGGEKMENAAEN
jgi:hypothetical protein